MGIVLGRCALELGFDALRCQDQIKESWRWENFCPSHP